MGPGLANTPSETGKVLDSPSPEACVDGRAYLANRALSELGQRSEAITGTRPELENPPDPAGGFNGFLPAETENFKMLPFQPYGGRVGVIAAFVWG
jgi:hypothetical protein